VLYAILNVFIFTITLLLEGCHFYMQIPPLMVNFLSVFIIAISGNEYSIFCLFKGSLLSPSLYWNVLNWWLVTYVLTSIKNISIHVPQDPYDPQMGG
jgi:hypothetical protein